MSSSGCEHFDLVIVGGGIVGATLAGLLKGLPLRVALVDRAAFSEAPQSAQSGPQPTFDPRVSALTDASQGLFRRIGVWDAIESIRACPYRDMDVWDGDGTGRVQFSAAAIRRPQLGHIVENSIVTGALHRHLRDQENLQLIAPATLTELTVQGEGDDLRATLGFSDRDDLSATLLIGADGANSRVRTLAHFAVREWDYRQQALVTTVRTGEAHRHCALQRFMDTGPLAFLPLATTSADEDQHYCSIVWSAVPERATALMQMTDTEFRQELAAAIEHRQGAIEWADRRHCFPLRQRHVLDYVKDNVALVGDAAHTIHPLAGQGVNMGLLDAAVLAAELERGLAAGRSLADPVVLHRYRRKRVGHNLGMMWLMEGFKGLFSARAGQSLPLRWLRNAGMNGVNALPVVKNALARRAMGLDW